MKSTTYANRRALGLCGGCGSESEPDRAFCESCRAQNQLRVARQRDGIPSGIDRSKLSRERWMSRPICPVHHKRHADGLACKVYAKPEAGSLYPRGGNFDSTALVDLILGAA